MGHLSCLLYLNTLSYTQGTQVSSENQGNGSIPICCFSLLPSPPPRSDPARGSRPSIFSALALHCDKPRVSWLWDILPLAYFLSVPLSEEAPCQYLSLFLHFILFLVLDTQSFRLKANSGKKVTNHFIN